MWILVFLLWTYDSKIGIAEKAFYLLANGAYYFVTLQDTLISEEVWGLIIKSCMFIGKTPTLTPSQQSQAEPHKCTQTLPTNPPVN